LPLLPRLPSLLLVANPSPHLRSRFLPSSFSASSPGAPELAPSPSRMPPGCERDFHGSSANNPAPREVRAVEERAGLPTWWLSWVGLWVHDTPRVRGRRVGDQAARAPWLSPTYRSPASNQGRVVELLRMRASRCGGDVPLGCSGSFGHYRARGVA
jgi:hypothetical protein